MPRFRFRLEKVRRLRKREEDGVARELAGLLSKRAALLTRIENCHRRRRELMVSREALQLGEISIGEVRENGLRIEAVAIAETRTRGELGRLEVEVARKREDLLDRSKKRKALDKLRERRMEEHQLAESRQELREADDRPGKPAGMGIA